MRYRRIYERDDETCQYCGNGASSLDHLIPKVHGGTDRQHNLVAACGTCNRLKGEAEHPLLAASIGGLIGRDRTSRRHYPPLYWQVRTLGLPHEPVATNPRRSRWFDRTLLRLVFLVPGRERPFARRRQDVAVATLADQVPHFDLPEARRELDRLVAQGSLATTPHFYLLGADERDVYGSGSATSS